MAERAQYPSLCRIRCAFRLLLKLFDITGYLFIPLDYLGRNGFADLFNDFPDYFFIIYDRRLYEFDFDSHVLPHSQYIINYQFGQRSHQGRLFICKPPFWAKVTMILASSVRLVRIWAVLDYIMLSI
jgi:hypothetical protein